MIEHKGQLYAETKALAELRREKYYFTGRPCKNGHLDVRNTKTGICVTCAREYGRQQYWSDPDKSRKQGRESRWRHRDKNIALCRKYYRDNREAHLANCKEYYERNKDWILKRNHKWLRDRPDKQYEYGRRWRQNNRGLVTYYARKRQRIIDKATPAWADQDEIRYIYKIAGEEGKVVDHMVPLTSDRVCGLHCADNMRAIPETLNRYKWNRYWPDMPKDAD